jgi:hypothetical protein
LARDGSKGENASGITLDVDFASKQSKIVPNLERDFNGPEDQNASITNKTYEKVYSKKSFKPCER